MNRKPATQALIILVLFSLAITGCNMPVVTPPGQSSATEAATVYVPPAATAIPATSTPMPEPEPISSRNASQLKAVNIAPATNVTSLTWASDSSSLGLVSQNVDDAGNAVFTATVLDGRLNIKSLMASTNGDQFVRVSPDGHDVAAISADGGTFTEYDLADGNKAVVMISPQYRIYGVSFSPDGKTFSLTNGDAMSVDLYTLSQSSDPYPLTGFTTAAPVFDAGFTGNASTLVWHARGTIQLQDIASKAMGASFSHEDFVTAFTLSADGKVLASAAAKTVNGDYKPAVILWDAASGSELKTLVLENPATSLSFSPDGSLLAAATGNDVQIWDTASGTLITTLTGHSGAVNLAAFSPDGRSLVSVGGDNQLMLWEIIPAK
jgi:Tol biopolymer transport system component